MVKNLKVWILIICLGKENEQRGSIIYINKKVSYLISNTPTRFGPAPTSCPLCWSRVYHGQEILFQVLPCTSPSIWPAGQTSLLLEFESKTTNNPKQQHKLRARQGGGTSTSTQQNVDKIWKFQALSPRVEFVIRPSPTHAQV